MTTFHDIDEQIGQLRGLAPRLQAAEEGSVEELRKLARLVQRTVKDNEDGALAVVHLFNRYARPVELALYHAILCQVLISRLELEAETEESVVCAALSVNIPFWDLQDELNIQEDPLTDGQRERVHQHPTQAVAMLQALEVEDEAWLNIAAQHHESLDGSGYPAGLKGEAIDRMATVLNIAESYCAAVTDRDYRLTQRRRKRYHATSVLHEFHQQGTELPTDLLALLIKTIGVYPPGTWVQLHNSEIALVVRRQDSGSRPIVAAFGRVGQAPHPRPVQRDTSNSDYRVVNISAPPRQRAMIHLSSLWQQY